VGGKDEKNKRGIRERTGEKKKKGGRKEKGKIEEG